jgi:abortive infection bacteriophage resistance protein
MGLKPPLSYQDQIERLKKNGVEIPDPQSAMQILTETNYYRLSGYALQFRIAPQKSRYQTGTSFEKIHNLYLFDMELRNLLKPYLEKIEILCRTRIAYGFSLNKCQVPPHDGHYDDRNFYNQASHKKIIDSLHREENYNKDSLIVKHHRAKYENKMPLWVCVEIMSFSNLSKLYHAMYISDKKSIAASLSTRHDILSNHLHCLSNLRNKCAHGARLYNAVYNPPAMLGKIFLQKNPDLKNDTFLAYLLVMIRRLTQNDDKRTLIDSFLNLIDNYRIYLDLDLLGCPVNFEMILQSEIY